MLLVKVKSKSREYKIEFFFVIGDRFLVVSMPSLSVKNGISI